MFILIFNIFGLRSFFFIYFFLSILKYLFVLFIFFKLSFGVYFVFLSVYIIVLVGGWEVFSVSGDKVVLILFIFVLIVFKYVIDLNFVV